MYQNYKNVEYVKPSGLELKDRLVGVQRVTKVTKGGRAFGFSAIVVVGDENGVVGQGLGKSKEVSEAIAKAVEDAKKNLVRIPLNGTTLPHEQKGKFGGARVYLQPAAEGTGVIAGGVVRAVLESLGVHNVLSKSQGSSNPHNVVKATFDALLRLRSAKTQKLTLISLGLGTIGKSVTHEATPSILGMINKVEHLVSVQEA